MNPLIKIDQIVESWNAGFGKVVGISNDLIEIYFSGIYRTVYQKKQEFLDTHDFIDDVWWSHKTLNMRK